MKNNVVVSVAVVLFIFAFMASVFANDVIWDNIARGNLHLRTVLIDPDNPQVIYIGSSNAIFKSKDGGESWRNILSIRGQNKAVNLLLFEPKDKNSLYAATGAGLFFSNNQGNSWVRIFKGTGALESECTTLAVLSSNIYLGTKGGLFISKDKGRSWHKHIGRIGDSEILAIACNLNEQDYIYVACIDGILKSRNKGETWERVFVAKASENGDDEEEMVDYRDEQVRSSDMRYISIDPNNANYLYLATAKGMYKSKDKGQTWNLLAGYGLLSRDIRFLLVSGEPYVYAATKTSIFKYKDNRWQELSFGFTAEDIRFLALDNQGNLFVACNRGLFKVNLSQFSDTQENSIVALYSKDEPKIDKVQQAAIKYAEVAPGKIMLWRKQAAKKACLPQVNVGLDRNVTDLWHWEGGSTTKIDDDNLRKGKDALEWSVSFSWNLGELIWNDDQTSIDVRSRLMVQLRDDILDEVTKLYFERLRVKIELSNLNIIDVSKRIEKELRLHELTASIDALTGGYFSEQIKTKS